MATAEFRKKVYQIIKKIPKEKVLTYKQAAEKLGAKNLAREVRKVLK